MKKLMFFPFLLFSNFCQAQKDSVETQVVELFRISQLAWCIVEHLPIDTEFIESIDADTFYTSVVRKKELLFLEVKSTTGLWRRELRVRNVIVFWHPKSSTGGLIIQQRMRWNFYDLWGIGCKKPNSKPSTVDACCLQYFLVKVNEYIFSKK